MKFVNSALIAFSMFVPVGTLTAQTLASPPASSATSAPAKAAPAKKQEATLGDKVNAVIKKQTPQAPAPAAKPSTTAATSSTAKPKPAANDSTQAAKPSAVTQRLSKVDRLITEREQLVLKYDYLKTQGNNFWGKASKEDLLLVVDALKEVLQKDEQIIQAVEQANLETRRSVAKRAAELEAESKKLNNQVKGDKRVITDNIYDLKASVTNAQNLLKKKDRQLRDLEEQLQDSKDAKFDHDAIAAFFAMLSLVLVGYIIKLRNRVAEGRASDRVKA